MYLAPLIDDLKIQWNDDVPCYDGYRNEIFTLKAVLLWTINNFLAFICSKIVDKVSNFNDRSTHNVMSCCLNTRELYKWMLHI